MKTLQLLPLLLVGYLGQGIGTLWATTFLQRPFPQTVEDAPRIARGKILSKDARWWEGPDGSRRIYTYYEFEISEPLKGDFQVGQSITFREIGGEKDGVGFQIIGAANFQSGDDVVVLLSEPQGSPEFYEIRGLMMGRLGVRKDPDSGEEILEGPAISGDTHPHIREAKERHTHEASLAQASEKWTLKRLRSLLREQGVDPLPIQTRSPRPENFTNQLSPHSPVPAPSLLLKEERSLQSEDSLTTDLPRSDASSPLLRVAVGLLVGMLLGSAIFWWFKR